MAKLLQTTYYLGQLLPDKHKTFPYAPGPKLFPVMPDMFRVFVYDTCTSSLDAAWELIMEGSMTPGDSVLCRSQTRGRGRMGRKWQSARGNVFAAWMIPFPESSECISLLPLILGLTFTRVLQGFGIQVYIKWPNDLIHHNRKVGGILIEEKGSRIAAGVGLNLINCPEAKDIRENSVTQPGHLKAFFAGVRPDELWAKLVYQAHIWYEDILCNFSFIDFIPEINSNLWLIGEKVCIESSGYLHEGILEGIGNKGEIILSNPSGVVQLADGSIRQMKY